MSSTLALHFVLVLSAALLLGVAGVAKLWRPSFTTGALSTVGLPSAPAVVRLLAVVEIVIAVDVLGWGGVAPLTALTLLYVGFTVFSAVLLRRDPDASCGCFGTRSPIGPVHVVVNALVALVTAAAVVTEPPALPETLSDGPWPPAVPVLLVLAATGGLLALLTRTVRPGSTSTPPAPAAGRPTPATITGVRIAASAADGRSGRSRRNRHDDPTGTSGAIDATGDRAHPGSDEGITTIALHDNDTVVLLLSPTCLTCRGIWRELHRPPRTLVPRGTDLVIVVERDTDLTAVAELAPGGVPTIAVDGVLEHLGAPGAPWAIRIDGATGRTTAEGTGSSWADLRRLLGF